MMGRTISVDPEDRSRAARERAGATTDYLRRIQEQQELDLLDFDNELDCAILGDAAYKITWDPDLGRPEITPPDVTGLSAWWQPDNLCRLRRVASQYALDNQQISDLYSVTLDQRRPSRTLPKCGPIRAFQLYIGSQLVRDEPNPYGFIPIVIYPNLRRPHQFWGESDDIKRI